MSFLDYVVLAAYFLLMIWIGRIAMKRVKAQEDYFMGGRQFGKWLQAFAAFGAGTGSSDPVNTARTSFTSGMGGIWSTMSWLNKGDNFTSADTDNAAMPPASTIQYGFIQRPFVLFALFDGFFCVCILNEDIYINM